MKKHIEVTVGTSKVSVVADKIGDKKQKKKVIAALRKAANALENPAVKKEVYGNEIVVRKT